MADISKPLVEGAELLAARAAELGITTPKLPFKSIMMDGKQTLYWNDLSGVHPTALEDISRRIRDMGTMWGHQSTLEFVDAEGRFHIARDIPANREALRAAGFKNSSNWTHYTNGNTPAGAERDEFYAILRTPQHETERLEWSVGDMDIGQFRHAIEHGADVTKAKGSNAPLLIDVVGKRAGEVRDEMVKTLLPHCKDQQDYLHGGSVLSAALSSEHSSVSILPDIIKTTDPFLRDKKGGSALFNVHLNKPTARQELKMVFEAMQKAEGVTPDELQMARAHYRIMDAALEKGDRAETEKVTRGLRNAWEFAQDMHPGETGKIPSQVGVLLAPLKGAAGAPKPLEAKGVKDFLEIVTHPDLTHINNLSNDLTREFTAHVVLPQALADYANRTGQPLTDEFLKGVKSQELMETLAPAVRRKLFEGRSIDTVQGLTAAWHDDGVIFPDTLKPIRAMGDWHSLTGSKTHAVPDLPGVTLHVLTSSHELEQEGKLMHHCVGRGDYATKCLGGDAHIFSVRQEGAEVPLATIEASWNGKQLEVNQNYAARNKPAPEEAKKAEAWIKEQLESGKIAPVRELGETAESKKQNARPEILRTIGFEVDQANINNAFMEYTRNPKRRGRDFNRETKKFDIISRRKELIAGSMHAEGGKSISYKDLGADQWYEASGMQSAVQEAFDAKMAKYAPPPVVAQPAGQLLEAPHAASRRDQAERSWVDVVQHRQETQAVARDQRTLRQRLRNWGERVGLSEPAQRL